MRGSTNHLGAETFVLLEGYARGARTSTKYRTSGNALMLAIYRTLEMRILFFHGFESELPSGKASWLEGEGYRVYARPMEYDRPDAFFGALACAQEFKPDVIIGSSMGGYFASLVGTHLNTKLVLLNPALHSRTREYDHAPNGGYHPKVWALLGENG